MSLLKAYETQIKEHKIENDPLQREIISHFERILDAFSKPKRSWFSILQPTFTKGIYLYGTVGAGKTYLMDLFFQNAPIENKVRLHFHHFMQQVDNQLRQLQGTKNPLSQIAAHFIHQTRLLCLDEMLVNDVAHAMILAELFQALFKAGVIVIITSNTAPEDLYANGVQRVRFLPAIAAIKQNCEILQLKSKIDHRLARAPSFQTYLYPLTNANEEILKQQFQAMGEVIQPAGEIRIQKRLISYKARTEKYIWFDFQALCNLPRSQLDYLEIANYFSTIFISDTPKINPDSANATLFVLLIDVLYDMHTRLFISAAVSVDQLLIGDRFKRTRSRLEEMQSKDYFLK